MPEDRRHIAVMFTDIVGYTALMGSDEDKAFDMLKRNHTTHATLIKKHNGKLVKEVGDGTLASFPLASDAVRCAIDIQKEAKSQSIPLKIGIHEGEMVMAGEDVLGDGVNVASRLQEISAEGSITISGRVYEDVKNKAGIKTKFIGDKRLKNVEDPVKVYEVLCEEETVDAEKKQQPRQSNKRLYFVIGGLIILVAAILIWFNLPKQPDIEVEKSIAVLPFRNDSPDPENEYFCNGMMETILNHLVKVGDLKVMSRTDVEPFRNTSKSRKEIASELGVANILEGSVFKIGNNFRISIQLINPESGFHLWSDEYEGEYTEELFEIQSNIAIEVAAALKAVITPEEERDIEQIPTKNMAAYDLMMRAINEISKYQNTGRDSMHLILAHKLIDKALEIDPQYLDAIAHKSLFFLDEQNYDSAYIYAKRILEIDPKSHWGFVALAEYYHFTGDGIAAIENFELALKYYQEGNNLTKSEIENQLGLFYIKFNNDYQKGLKYIQYSINDRDSMTYGHCLYLGGIFLSLGDYKKAKIYANKLLERTDWVICYGIDYTSSTLMTQGKYNDAINFLDSICSITLCDNLCNLNLLLAHSFLGQYDQAIKYFNPLRDDRMLPMTFDSLLLAFNYKELGEEQDAKLILDNNLISLETNLTQNKDFFTFLQLSMTHALLGEKETSMKYLSDAIEQGSAMGWHDLLPICPIYKNYWGDPEFKVLVRKAQEERAAKRKQVEEMIESGEIDL